MFTICTFPLILLKYDWSLKRRFIFTVADYWEQFLNRKVNSVYNVIMINFTLVGFFPFESIRMTSST